MSRGKSAASANKRKIKKKIDSRYDSPMVEKLIRSVMRDGKASIARSIVYEAIAHTTANMSDQVELPEHSDVREKEALTLNKVIEIITPRVEVKSKRVGGANYQVPVIVNKDRGVTLALRWLVSSARDSKAGKPMSEKLAKEMLDTLAGKSSALGKKETQDRMASANRANANLARRDNAAQKSDEA